MKKVPLSNPINVGISIILKSHLGVVLQEVHGGLRVRAGGALLGRVVLLLEVLPHQVLEHVREVAQGAPV